jgi:alkylation response protein AidB-like acyl-CoA dehydrogenase
VEIRPIRNLTGETDFNEVFFDNATTQGELVVGPINKGWSVAMTLLGFERGETALHAPIRFRNELSRLADLIRDRGLVGDPGIRRAFAWCHVQVEQLRCHGRRIAAQLIQGDEPGPGAAAFKLLWSEYHRVVTELALDVLGLEGLAPSGRPSPNWYHTDDPRGAELLRVVDERLPQLARRHDLRRVVAGPAEHHRRDGARPSQGAPSMILRSPYPDVVPPPGVPA